MPDPSKFTDKAKWMDVCMHQVKTVEGESQAVAVAKCLAMFRDKGKKKKKCASDILRKIAEELKESMPYLETLGNLIPVDLKFEALSKEDKEKVIEDLEKGIEITLHDGSKTSLSKIKHISTLGSDEGPEGIIKTLKKYLKNPSKTIRYIYDETNHKYEKVDSVS